MLYLDATALVKRYVEEEGSDLVRGAMAGERDWFMCRIGFVETVRAVGLSAGSRVAATVRREWSSFGVIEVDAELSEHAAELTLAHELRSLDALHLAAALLLPKEAVTVATWDVRLRRAARETGLRVLPEQVATQ
ncbi:MAG TPA: type II toxin-antitoxin system VapC family toxin [Conexibacter sp.]|nr:type II toxin-antitoxin system VapC family toxin [Conexibacter sp.]